METAQQEITTLERLVGAQGASPLFARLADLYLQAGRPKDALRVCDAGLANFPFYSTGHFVKGRALIALDMTNEARRELELVRDWLPANPTIWSYLDSLPASEEQFLTEEAAPEESVSSPVEADPVVSPVSPTDSTDQPEGFFGAITEAEVPSAVVDTSSSATSPAEENVFGLPSEAPAGFGGFGGGGSTEETPQAFTGFGGFGEPTETPIVAERETPEPAVEAFSGFGAAAVQPEWSTPTTDEPTVSFEETVTNALGDGAPGFVPEFVSSVSESTIDAYADRMRLELGPTGLITLEQFLAGEEIVPNDSVASSAGFGSDGFTATETSSEPTPEPQEITMSDFSGPDFSGLPTMEDSVSTPPVPEMTATNDGGFSGPAFEGPPSDTSIEGLTEKLQNAKKITPIIDFSTKTSTDAGEENPMTTSGFVTPTLAEIYAKQGWYDDAIKAYRALAKTKPAEREKFETRIAELEEEKKKQA